jgi:unspecific monooxygenase
MSDLPPSRLPQSFAYDSATHSLSLDPRAPDFFLNPYPSYAALHAASDTNGPIMRWQDYGHWVFGGLKTVNALFRDKRLGRQILHRTTREALGWPDPSDHTADFDRIDACSLLELEPPDHTRLRALINRAFISRNVETLGPAIAAEATAAMDSFADEPIDLLASFAEPVAANTIARMLGIDQSYVPKLLAWSHAMVAMYAYGRDRTVEEKANRAAREFTDFVREQIVERRASPGTDLLSHLITAHEDADRLSEPEIISTTILLLNAGHEATVHAMGNGLATLFSLTAEQRNHALANPVAMTEEILRHTPPLHMFTRYVLEDCELYGVPFEQGDVIGLHLGLANRDPRAMPDPDTFDVDRASVKQVAFGAGIHFCIGHTLARLEMATAIPMLLERFPQMSLAAPPRFKNAYHFHGFDRLLVNLGGAD